MLTYMTAVDDMLTRLMAVQRRNASLTGPDLAAAASAVARLAREHRAVVLAADGTGDRIVGAALAAHSNDVVAADTTARLSDQVVLVVSGAVAGPVGLSQVAARLRSLGASALHAGVLDGADQAISGYATVEPLTAQADSAVRRERRSQRRTTTAA
jgi:hypothetical protein